MIWKSLSRRSFKRTPSGPGIGAPNRSWPLTRMVLISGHYDFISGTSVKFIRSGLLSVVLKHKQKSEGTNSPEGGINSL